MSVSQERIFEIAQEAAPRLIGAWRFNRVKSQPETWNPMAVISDDKMPGREIGLRRCWRRKDRLAISGHLPRIGGYAPNGNRITVNPQRSAKAIAGDINRRLLPAYLKAWEEQQAELYRHERQDEKFLHKLHLLEGMCKGLRPAGHDALSSSRFYWAGTHRRTFTLEIYRCAADNVRLEMSLPFADAVRLLAFLADLG